jgi:hypothetical protein
MNVARDHCAAAQVEQRREAHGRKDPRGNARPRHKGKLYKLDAPPPHLVQPAQ